VLTTPQLTLLDSAGNTLQTATAWSGSEALTTAFQSVGAFALVSGSADSALEVNVSAGAYTSQVAGVGGTTGLALAEIYDGDPASTGASLVNLSARGNVGTGAAIIIAGFVVEGDQPVNVLLRGVGPTLGAAPFGLSGVLAAPQIQLYNSAGDVIQSNTGWADSAALAAAAAEAGAFALAAGSADAAMVASLPAGSYTLQLSGQDGGSGIALVEVYLLP